MLPIDFQAAKPKRAAPSQHEVGAVFAGRPARRNGTACYGDSERAPQFPWSQSSESHAQNTTPHVIRQATDVPAPPRRSLIGLSDQSEVRSQDRVTVRGARAACCFKRWRSNRAPFFQTINVIAAIFRAKVSRHRQLLYTCPRPRRPVRQRKARQERRHHVPSKSDKHCRPESNAQAIRTHGFTVSLNNSQRVSKPVADFHCRRS
jgi:hypothetical protein